MRKKKGFTLVELVIVIAVIAILAAVLIPTFAGILERARESSRIQQVTSARNEFLSSNKNIVSIEEMNGFVFVIEDNIYTIENGEIIKPKTPIDIENGYTLSSVSTSNSNITIYEPLKVVFEESPYTFSVDLENNTATVTGIWNTVTNAVIPSYLDSVSRTTEYTKKFKDFDEFYMAYEDYRMNMYEENATEGKFYVSQDGTNFEETDIYMDPFEYYEYSAFQFVSTIEIYQLGKNNIKVVSIGENAFSDNTSITNLELPSTIESVQMSAFRNCINLNNVQINSNEIVLNHEAFYGCKNLKNINLENVVSIGTTAFANCSSLTELSLSTKLTNLETTVFYSCTSLETVEIPSSITTLPRNTFSKCSNLKNVILPNNIIAIDNWAFENCTNLQTINLPTTLTSIGENVFNGCENLEILTIENNITYAKSEDGNTYFVALKANDTTLTNYSINNNTIIIAANAFKSCSKATNITIGDNVKYIGKNSFSYCTLITNLVIPNSVLNIEEAAFAYNQNLQEVVIGNNVKTVGINLFNDCKLLSSVELGNSLEHIGTAMFANCKALTEITIPNSVKSIDYSAFNASGIIDIEIPDSVETIGEYCFRSCKSLNTFSSGTGLRTIKQYAFESSTITTLNIKEGLETIEKSAFYNCSSLSTLNLPTTLTTIGESSFFKCTSIINLVLPSGVKHLGRSAFYGCSNLLTIDFANVEHIDHYVFAECKKLTTIVLPDTVTFLGSTSFDYNPSIKTVILSKNLTDYYYSTFGFSSVLKFNVYEGLKYLGTKDNPYFFLVRTNSTTITSCKIHKDVKMIATSCFRDVKNLTTVNYEGSEEMWASVKICNYNDPFVSATKVFLNK